MWLKTGTRYRPTVTASVCTLILAVPLSTVYTALLIPSVHQAIKPIASLHPPWLDFIWLTSADAVVQAEL